STVSKRITAMILDIGHSLLLPAETVGGPALAACSAAGDSGTGLSALSAALRRLRYETRLRAQSLIAPPVDALRCAQFRGIAYRSRRERLAPRHWPPVRRPVTVERAAAR